MFDLVPEVKAIVLVSCCYHKMTFKDDVFENFPFSSYARQHYEQMTSGIRDVSPPSSTLSGQVLCRPITQATLRLGAQETKCRWRNQTADDHADHTRHVAYRGLLELIDSSNPARIRHRVRKCDFSNFDAFVRSYLQDEKDPVVSAAHEEALRLLHDKHVQSFHLIETLTCLQTVVQPVIESMIYTDRLMWLRAKGHEDSHIVPVFDDLVSPRNLAFVAVK